MVGVSPLLPPGWKRSCRVFPYRFTSLEGPAASGEDGSSVLQVIKESLKQRQCQVSVLSFTQTKPMTPGASRENCAGSGEIVLGEDLVWLHAFLEREKERASFLTAFIPLLIGFAHFFQQLLRSFLKNISPL